VISPSEIGHSAGLIYVNQNGFIELKKAPKKLKPRFINHAWISYIYKKLCFRRLSKYNEILSIDDNCFFVEESV
jgi:hypothetical protein